MEYADENLAQLLEHRALAEDEAREKCWCGRIRVLEFFGAVPNLRIPDNLKAAIKKAPVATARGALDLRGLH